MDTTGIRALILRARDGDRAAADELLRRVAPHLEPIAHSYANSTRPEQSTQDILQAAGTRIWLRLNQFDVADEEQDKDTGERFIAWAKTITANVGKNDVRDADAKKRRPATPLVSLGGMQVDDSDKGVPDPVDPGPGMSTFLRGLDVRQALQKLPADQREVVELVYFEDLTLQEVADRLGRTYDQVRYLHKLALKALEKTLE